MCMMRLNYLPYPLALVLLTVACNRPCYNDNVVCETYVHRYGVPLDRQDWSARGQHGQIVTTRKDGVIVAKNYNYGVLHGETTYTFPHRDDIHKKEWYEEGELTQEEWNHSNGMPQQRVVYHSPSQQTHVVWYESGVPHCKEEYEDGQLVQGEYFSLSNQVETKVEAGHGVRTRREANGQLLSLDEFQDGQMKLRTTYHANGAPASLTPYVNGKAEGKKCTFLPGGEPNTIEEWRNDVQQGNTIEFQNGEKYADVPYQNGQRHGVERRYRNGNTLTEEVSWVRGQRHGPSYSYIGNDKKVSWYVQDREVNKPTYDVFERQ